MVLGGSDVSIKFTEIEEHEPIRLHIHKGDNHFALGAMVKKHLNEQFTLIGLDYSGTQTLVFDNVDVDVEYFQTEDVPLMWRKVRVISQKNAYVLQVLGDPIRHNRRDSFRLSVAKLAWLKLAGEKPQQIMVKDVSLSGFAITDQKKELHLSVGDQLSISFEDWGYQLDLDGRIVRIEEREDMTIYGLTIRNLCKDLSAYINNKQRRAKKQNT